VGPDVDGKQTYCPVSEWAGKQEHRTGDRALEELCLRYLRGYGPADARDFAAWSGLPVAEAKKGLDMAKDNGDLRAVVIEDRLLWSPEAERSAYSGPVVNLLPAFDSFVLGYADREYLVPGQYRKEVYHGGQTVPVVLVDGMAAGVWRYERQGKAIAIAVRPFGHFDRETAEGVEREAADIGRFFGSGHRLCILPGLPG
jgi:hypothetical protein